MKVKTIVLLLFISVVTFSQSKNSVEYFFKSAERQMETQDQCKELQNALKDLLRLNDKEILLKKYKNYQGIENQWTFFRLLRSYYVTTYQKNLDEKQFLKDAKKKRGQISIRSALHNLGSCDSGIK